MTRTFTLFLVVVAAILFVGVDSLSALWARQGNYGSQRALFYLASMCVVGPIAYALFGYLTQRVGVSVTSGLVNTSIVIGTILVGILFFHDAVTTRQIIGLVLAVLAVALLA
jgi:drug/metabolite transporter (DMT)-like permease